MMERKELTIEIYAGRTVTVPGLLEAIRATERRIMAEKLQVAMAGAGLSPFYDHEQAAIYSRVRGLLQMAAEMRAMPLDALYEQFQRWAGTRLSSRLECAEQVYQVALTMAPFPWEKNDHE